MRLELFSSVRDKNVPNLVSLQNPKLSALPTVLVCPMKESITVTPLRVAVNYSNRKFTVACDLLRPIHRQVLRPAGQLDERTSREILRTFFRMLPD
jgi:mRNA-degrading endonuclease toxin of MazEF toxin-antitoxin module